MPEDEIRAEVVELVEPRSMATETIVEELTEVHSKRAVQMAVVDMINEGRLEEHPEFLDVYRVADE